MNDQFKFCDTPDLEALVGSHLYGVSTPTSDQDLRGFVVEPAHLLIGMDRFEQREYEDSDKVIFGLKKFMKTLMSGNMNILEVLFATQFTHCTEFGQRILDNRDLFISKTYYKAIRGFAMSEFRKARAVSLALEYKDEDDKEILTRLAGKFQLKRFEISEILDIIFASRDGDPRTEVSSTRFLGARRKQNINTNGYSTKNAYHAIRLLDEGIELLSTGNITFPRPSVDLLRTIRNAEITIEEIEVLYKEYETKLDETAALSKMKERPDNKQIKDLYLSIVKDKLQSEWSRKE